MEQPQDRLKRLKSAALIAIAIAAPAEGVRQIAYYDPPGILTVCRGHTGTDVVKNRKYSLAECDQFMTDDMREAIEIVERCAPGLPENVLAAFGDAVFNIGPKIACDTKHSTAARLLKSGKTKEACRELPKWNKANIGGSMVPLPGLTKRRQSEMEICLGDNDANT